MKLTTDQTAEVLGITTLSDSVQLLKAYALETKGLEKTIKKVTYGIKIPFHYNWLELGLYKAKTKSGTIRLKGKTYKLESMWEERDDRIGLAKKALLDLLTEPSKYKAR